MTDCMRLKYKARDKAAYQILEYYLGRKESSYKYFFRQKAIGYYIPFEKAFNFIQYSCISFYYQYKFIQLYQH